VHLRYASSHRADSVYDPQRVAAAAKPISAALSDPHTVEQRCTAAEKPALCPGLVRAQPYRFAAAAQQRARVAEVCTEYLELAVHLLAAVAVEETRHGGRSVLDVFPAIDIEATTNTSY
jgi:hypothetical protein